jgi:hypothetical protein
MQPIGTKMGWATFWAIFVLKTHLVTLASVVHTIERLKK